MKQANNQIMPNKPAGPKVKCPYCGSEFTSKETLSKHIDRIHIGSGLLEGDKRKW